MSILLTGEPFDEGEVMAALRSALQDLAVGRTVTWTGPTRLDWGSVLNGLSQPPEALSEEQLASHADHGTGAYMVLVGVAFSLGVEQGRRRLSREVRTCLGALLDSVPEPADVSFKAATQNGAQEGGPLKTWWVSWEQPVGEDKNPGPLGGDPLLPWVQDFWVTGFSGEDDEFATICALVVTPDETAALREVYKHWPDAGKLRFCREKPIGWRPDESRFPCART